MTLTELLLLTFLAALVTDLATGLGAVPFFFVRTLSDRFKGAFTAAAAGMMTAASVFQLLGEAAHLAPGWGIWEVAVGVLLGACAFMYASDWLRANDSFDVGGLRRAGGATAILIVAALTIHSLPEGIAIGVAFGATPETGEAAFGMSVALALAVHNIPEGVAITVALRGQGVSTLRCMGWAVVSSIPQPVGAVPSAWAVWLFEPLLPAGLGFAAGAMMYLVVDELMEEAYADAGHGLVAVSFVSGLVLMVVLGRVVGLS